ncbi:UxaA family hydrolase [Escherichia coli]
MEGYVRQNGRPGIRNTVQVIFMVECAAMSLKRLPKDFLVTTCSILVFQVVIPAIMAIGW